MMKDDIKGLQIRKEDLVRDVNAIIYPNQLWWGFVVLGIFSFVGLLFPLIVMTFENYSRFWHKTVPLIVFIVGFLSVLVFIYFQISGLSKD